MPPQLCDPYDALSHGLLIALQKYKLQSDQDFEDYLDRVLPYLEDPRYVEAVDDLFVRRIEEILEGMYNWRFRFSTHQAIGDATKVLALLRDNANLGKGIGIDEYENAPPAKKDRIGRGPHNTKVVRHLVVEHLSEELQTDRRNIFSALKALRLSTRQALHEGWLPC
ncbi:MAG: hypothetical protein HY782_00940 [Chloroflexi bacterium]|nr:hypothetical protein [Chloroflexota bacterium]